MNELVQAFMNKSYLRARVVLLLKRQKITFGVSMPELMQERMDSWTHTGTMIQIMVCCLPPMRKNM